MTETPDTLGRMSEEDKVAFAGSIGTLRFEDNRRLFTSLLGDESFRVRKTALESLLKTQDPDKLTGLFIDIINSQDNAGLRTAGVEGLTKTGKKAIKHIVQAIDAEQWELSKLLVDVLGDIGDPEVIPVLIKLTSSPQQNLSTAATEALGKIGTEDVVPSITKLLKQKEIYIVFSAIEALANLGKKEFSFLMPSLLVSRDTNMYFCSSEKKIPLYSFIKSLSLRKSSSSRSTTVLPVCVRVLIMDSAIFRMRIPSENGQCFFPDFLLRTCSEPLQDSAGRLGVRLPQHIDDLHDNVLILARKDLFYLAGTIIDRTVHQCLQGCQDDRRRFVTAILLQDTFDFLRLRRTFDVLDDFYLHPLIIVMEKPFDGIDKPFRIEAGRCPHRFNPHVPVFIGKRYLDVFTETVERQRSDGRYHCRSNGGLTVIEQCFNVFIHVFFVKARNELCRGKP